MLVHRNASPALSDKRRRAPFGKAGSCWASLSSKLVRATDRVKKVALWMDGLPTRSLLLAWPSRCWSVQSLLRRLSIQLLLVRAAALGTMPGREASCFGAESPLQSLPNPLLPVQQRAILLLLHSWTRLT
uniref:Uncharacterized protein n=1 Tax=Mycena chlorophos TaxID=658473 RepID=A0ABQ0M9F5_MYCCL|nr:predicted protein [Mycena chlorophos]